MATVDELRARREALLKALGEGVKVEQYEGRRVEYASPDELQRAVARLDREIKAAGGTGPRRRLKIVVGKGL